MVTRETFDDVFDEDVDEDIIHRKEWNKIKTDLKKDGFRDGLDTGQEATLQLGFNEGYTQAVRVCEKLGCLRGRLSAHLSWRRPKENTFEVDGENRVAEIESLIKEISNYEKHLVTLIKQQPIPPINEMDSAQTSTGTVHSEGIGDSSTTEGKESDCDGRTDCSSGRCQDGSSCCQATLGQRETTLQRTNERIVFERLYSNVLSDVKTKYENFAAEVEKVLICK